MIPRNNIEDRFLVKDSDGIELDLEKDEKQKECIKYN